jgi:hypothetical protein
MADWRQIQARIRKAKNAPDAHAKLSELYQRTRDAMVAWELGLLEEKTLVQAEAVKWYTIAAQRFRRADWKKKAEEALARLGAEVPAAGAEGHSGSADAEHDDETSPSKREARGESQATRPQLAVGEIPENEEEPEADEESEGDEEKASAQGDASASSGAGAAEAISADNAKRKRRRGRRGGRGRRKRAPGAAPGLPSQAFAETSSPPAQQAVPPRRESRHESRHEPRHDSKHEAPRPPAERPSLQLPDPQLPSERTAHGRAGDPALASRMSQLESRLRRLLSSPLHHLDAADEAPAGPGVFLLSDADQTASYYIEACQTLRIGLGNLTRGGRSGKSSRGGYGESGLKAKLAEHLGINEAKVSQYLKDHCVVRWIQLDEEAPMLAHFAISLLRTPLNLD